MEDSKDLSHVAEQIHSMLEGIKYDYAISIMIGVTVRIMKHIGVPKDKAMNIMGIGYDQMEAEINKLNAQNPTQD